MTIVSWNCNGALRKKYQLLEQFQADIFIIQECENPIEATDRNYKAWAKNHIWIGDSKHKGLGIFCKPSIKLYNNNWPTNGTRHFLSARINDEFNLIGVWCHQSQTSGYDYIGQFWQYLQQNKERLAHSLILGDFNSNTIWDKKGRKWNHSKVVEELDRLQIRSLYHEFYEEEQGSEQSATFYLQKNLAKKYHIDYAFACKTYFANAKDLKIGNPEEWLVHSDHMPVCVFL